MTQPKTIANASRRTGTGLNQYTGTWTKWEVKHLLSRTLFGYSGSDITAFLNKGLDQAVNDLLSINTAPPSPPINDYASGTSDTTCAFGDVWVTAAINSLYTGLRRSSLKNWWYRLMLDDKTIREKMVLFWQNHFATELDQQADPRSAYYHLKILRDNSLGDFKLMVKQITTDPQMLFYLNGQYNISTAPDENYARELQELFTVGKELNPHYTEDDVKMAAKVLTGWRINRTVNPPVGYFDKTKHDATNKTFSSFYNGATVTGNATDTGGDAELDSLLSIIFNHVEVAKNICRKLYRFFVYYEIDAAVENDVIVPLATIFRSSNYDIKTTMAKLLKSEHFYDMANRGCIIKNPVDFVSGFAKHTNLNLPYSGQTADVAFSHFTIFRTTADNAGMSIFDPPNVAGWPAYYQSPQYHELWINSNTMPLRIAFLSTYLNSGISRLNYKVVCDLPAITSGFSNASVSDSLITDALELFLPMPPTTDQKAKLKEILLPGGIAEYNWTDPWNAYVANPTTTTLNAILPRLKTFYSYIFSLSEYQLQ